MLKRWVNHKYWYGNLQCVLLHFIETKCDKKFSWLLQTGLGETFFRKHLNKPIFKMPLKNEFKKSKMSVNYKTCKYIYISWCQITRLFWNDRNQKLQGVWSSLGGRGVLGIEQGAAGCSQPVRLQFPFRFFILLLCFILSTAGFFTEILSCGQNYFQTGSCSIPSHPIFFLVHLSEICWCEVKSQ